MTKHSTLLHYAVGALLCASLFYTSYAFSQNTITGGGAIVNGQFTSGSRDGAAAIDRSCDFGSGFDYGFGRSIDTTVTSDSGTTMVTWSFSSNGKPARCGKFADGSWWVAPAPGETEVTFNQVSVTGSLSDGVFVDDNPQLEALGLLPPANGSNYGNYTASETLSFPATYSNDVSLVAAVRSAATLNCGTGAVPNCILFYDVLTVLEDVPPTFGADILRPSIDEPAKDLMNLYTDFDLSRIPSQSDLTGFADADEIAEAAQRWRHDSELFSLGSADGSFYSEGGRGFRANTLTNNYGATKTRVWNTDIEKIFSDDQNTEQLKEVIAAQLVYAKDIFYGIHSCTSLGCARERTWLSGAGQWSGRGTTAAYFAALAKNIKYKNTMKVIPLTYNGSCEAGAYQEMEQINLTPNGPVWGDGCDTIVGNTTEGLLRYWNDYSVSPCREGNNSTCPGFDDPYLDLSTALGNGQRTAKDPHDGGIDGPPEHPGAVYSRVTLGNIISLAMIMELMPEFAETINYPAMITYAKRMLYVGSQATPDACAPIDPREPDEWLQIFRANSVGHIAQYFGYDSTTGIATYGPDPRDPTYKACIAPSTTCTSSTPSVLGPDSWTCVAAQPGDANFGQTGRFTSRHGYPTDPQNASPQFQALFSTYFPDDL